MTHDVEERLVAVLHRRADDDVDADGLLSASLARGRGRQRRRRITIAFGAAGVAGLTAAALAAVPVVLSPGTPETGSPDGSATWPAGLPDASGRPLMPARGVVPLPATGAHPVPQLAGEEPGAADRPDLVGTNPLAIHFRLADAPLPVAVVRVSAADGLEAVYFEMATPQAQLIYVKVELARGKVPRPARSGPGDGPSVTAPAAGSIGGRPVTQERLTERGWTENAVRWSPVDGVEARVASGNLSVDDLLRLASLVRLDKAARCTAPLQLTALPADTSVMSCEMVLNGRGPERPIVDALLEFGRRGSSMTVSVTSLVVPMASFGNQRTPLPSGVLAGEIPADGFEGRPGLVIFDLDGRRVEVIAEAGYGRNDVGLVTEGIRAAGEPTRFETWPERPVS